MGRGGCVFGEATKLMEVGVGGVLQLCDAPLWRAMRYFVCFFWFMSLSLKVPGLCLTITGI